MNIRPFCSEDLPQVLKLMADNYGRHYSPEWWKWKHEDNPFGKSIIRVAEDDGQIVGTRSLWAWNFNYMGRSVKAYQPCDTLVDRAYRGKGLFSKMTLDAISEAIRMEAQFLYNFPNNNSVAGYLKLGWQLVDNIPWYIKVTQISGLPSFNKQLKRRILDQNFCETVKVVPKEKQLDTSSIFKTLWSNKYIQWRYNNELLGKYKSFGNSSDSNIYSLYNNKGLKELVLLNSEISSDALDSAIYIGKRVATYIAVPANSGSDKEKLLKSKKFLKTKKGIHFVVKPLTAEFGKIVLDVQNWQIGLENIDTF